MVANINEFHEFLARVVYLCCREPRPAPVANRTPILVASLDCNKAPRLFSRVDPGLAGSRRIRTVLYDGPDPRSPSPRVACTANEFSSLYIKCNLIEFEEEEEEEWLARDSFGIPD